VANQPDWIDDPKAWNGVTLGETTLPGIWVVSVEKSRDVDFKKSPGNDGGTDTDKGQNPATVRLTGRVLRKDWPLWQQALPQIEPNRPGAFAAPLEIRNAEANSRGVTAVRVLKISSESPTARGAKTYTIECREWFAAPKKSKSKPKQNATLTDTTVKPNFFGAFSDARDAFAASGANRPPNEPDNMMENSFGGTPKPLLFGPNGQVINP
jgi:hypothetical protein